MHLYIVCFHKLRNFKKVCCMVFRWVVVKRKGQIKQCSTAGLMDAGSKHCTMCNTPIYLKLSNKSNESTEEISSFPSLNTYNHTYIADDLQSKISLTSWPFSWLSFLQLLFGSVPPFSDILHLFQSAKCFFLCTRRQVCN